MHARKKTSSLALIIKGGGFQKPQLDPNTLQARLGKSHSDFVVASTSVLLQASCTIWRFLIVEV